MLVGQQHFSINLKVFFFADWRGRRLPRRSSWSRGLERIPGLYGPQGQSRKGRQRRLHRVRAPEIRPHPLLEDSRGKYECLISLIAPTSGTSARLVICIVITLWSGLELHSTWLRKTIFALSLGPRSRHGALHEVRRGLRQAGHEERAQEGPRPRPHGLRKVQEPVRQGRQALPQGRVQDGREDRAGGHHQFRNKMIINWNEQQAELWRGQQQASWTVIVSV